MVYSDHRGSSQTHIPHGGCSPLEKLREITTNTVTRKGASMALSCFCFSATTLPQQGCPEDKQGKNSSCSASLLCLRASCPSSGLWCAHEHNKLAAVGTNAGNPFKRSSQQLPSCCKELGLQ